MYGTYDFSHIFSYDNRNADHTTAIALEVASGDVANALWAIIYPMKVKFLGYRVTVAFDYDTQTTEGVIAIDKRITPASDTGRVEVGRVDLEDGLAAGDVRGVFGGVAQGDEICDVGDELVLEVVTQAVGGTELGDWVPIIVMAPFDEVPGNQTAWTISSITQV